MQIYILNGQEQTGPFSTEEIERRITSGECKAETLAWHDGLEEWKPLSELLPQRAQPQTDQARIAVETTTVLPPPLPTTAQDAGRVHWYDHSLVVFPALAFCFPLGLLPLWLTNRFGKPLKIGLSAASFAAYFFAAALVWFGVNRGAAPQAREGGGTEKGRTNGAPSHSTINDSRATTDFAVFDGRHGTNVERAEVADLGDLVQGVYQGTASIEAARKCVFLPEAQKADLVQSLQDFAIYESIIEYRNGRPITVDFALRLTVAGPNELGIAPVRITGRHQFTTGNGTVRLLPVVEIIPNWHPSQSKSPQVEREIIREKGANF